MKSSEFRADLDPYLVRSMLLGTIEHIFFRWHLLDRKADLPDFTDDLMDVLMLGMRRESQPRALQINLSLPDLAEEGPREG